MSKARRLSTILLFLVSAPLTVNAEPPAFEEVTGHAFGERITQAYQMAQYLEAVAGASDRVVVEALGESWQGRPLMHAIVTAPENHARLEEIKANARRLGDPRGLSEAEAERIIADQPAVFWYGGSIHGFELSGSEAGLRMLERLARADDEATREILRNVVVIIDPMLNPDGRDAFAYHNHDRLGRESNPDNDDWSNDFNAWERLEFRTSHYFFDLNRDWFAHTHPEIRARLPVFERWRPQAGVDAHEMGAEVEFYVDPPTDPVGPFFPEHAHDWHERFGQAHARAFDAAGTEYMTRERYNFFYPAYTTSFLGYQGAVGMLYEQGSSRGLALTRPDGTVRRLEDTIANQYTAFEAALTLTAREREALLGDYVAHHREAVADGEQGARRYLFPLAENDPQMVAEVVNLLRRSGVEVGRLTGEARLRGVTDRHGESVGQASFAQGTFVVEAAQPRNRLIRVLLEPEVPVPEGFLEEARERVDRGESPRFYDITTWSLPLLYGIEAYVSSDTSAPAVEAVDEPVTLPARTPVPEPGYAYLIDGRQTAGLPALMRLREMGYRVAMLRAPTRIEGRDYAAGTGVVYARQSDGGAVQEDLREVAERYGLEVRAVDTGRAEGEHPSLGSAKAIPLKEVTVAVLAEEPVNAYSFGWAWLTLDRQYEQPVSVLRAGSLGSAGLEAYDTIVMPNLGDHEALERIAGEEGLERLARWVREGGTLVTIGAATEVARELELIELRSWYDVEEHEHALEVAVPGAMLATELDREHWLTAGVPDDFRALVVSDRVYLPPEGAPSPQRRVGMRYAADEAFAHSGHLWEESRERLPGAVFAYEERVEEGRVIAFAEDVSFRGYYRAGNRLFLNAVLVGPSAP